MNKYVYVLFAVYSTYDDDYYNENKELKGIFETKKLALEAEKKLQRTNITSIEKWELNEISDRW